MKYSTHLVLERQNFQSHWGNAEIAWTRLQQGLTRKRHLPIKKQKHEYILTNTKETVRYLGKRSLSSIKYLRYQSRVWKNNLEVPKNKRTKCRSLCYDNFFFEGEERKSRPLTRRSYS